MVRAHSCPKGRVLTISQRSRHSRTRSATTTRTSTNSSSELPRWTSRKPTIPHTPVQCLTCAIVRSTSLISSSLVRSGARSLTTAQESVWSRTLQAISLVPRAPPSKPDNVSLVQQVTPPANWHLCSGGLGCRWPRSLRSHCQSYRRPDCTTSQSEAGLWGYQIQARRFCEPQLREWNETVFIPKWGHSGPW